MSNKRWVQMVALLLGTAILASGAGLAEGIVPKGIIPTPPENQGLTVQIWVDKGAYTVGEPITVHYSVNKEAHVYIWDILPNGTTQQILQDYVKAGEHAIQGRVEPPVGREYLQILATTTPVNPFSFMGEDPEAFRLKLDLRILGVLPASERTWNFTSFEIVTGITPPYGTLNLSSTPTGAQITINGRYMGYTPRTLHLQQGYHQITLHKSGYRPWSRGIFIIGGRRQTINVKLSPIAPMNQPPIAAFNFSPSSPRVAEWVRFEGTRSYDPDGFITSYNWNFGDGSPNRSGSVVYHRFTAAGTYSVSLIVTDDTGARNSKTEKVTVGPINQAPIAAFNFSPSSPRVSEWVRFEGTASHDPDGSIASYSWSFGDGSAPTTGSVAYHQFIIAGRYAVTLTVIDDGGATDTETRPVQVGLINRPPVAAFTYSPPSTAIGEQIVLNASSSYDPDGVIVSYVWDLDGDGNDDTSGKSIPVRYYNPGMHLVRLTVTDNQGLSATTKQGITIFIGGGVPGGPPMRNTPGIFVWGIDTWHVTVNAGSTWLSPHSYKLELRTDGSFQNVNQSTSGGVTPLGIVPTPTQGGKTLLFEGSLQSGNVDYTFTVTRAKSIWMSLKLDMDGDSVLDESPNFVYLRNLMVHPPSGILLPGVVVPGSPFVIRVRDRGMTLVPSTNFSVCYAPKFGEGPVTIYYGCIRIEDLENR